MVVIGCGIIAIIFTDRNTDAGRRIMHVTHIDSNEGSVTKSIAWSCLGGLWGIRQREQWVVRDANVVHEELGRNGFNGCWCTT